MGVFHVFSNCINGSKSRKASHLFGGKPDQNVTKLIRKTHGEITNDRCGKSWAEFVQTLHKK